jgi:hypothetical protein
MKQIYKHFKACLCLFFLAFCVPLSMQAQNFTLSGSEHTIVNGVYTLNGVNALNQTRYTHSSGDYDLNYDGNGSWWLYTDKRGTQWYKASGTSTEPPLTGWMDNKAQSAPLTLVADPRNAEIIAAKKAALDAEPVVIKGLGDNIPDRTFQQMVFVPAVESTRIAMDTSSQLITNGQQGIAAASNGVVANLRVSWYRIEATNSSDCFLFFGDNPDPRYKITANGGELGVVKGADVNCGVWYPLEGNAKYFATVGLFTSAMSVSSSNPLSIQLDMTAWEEDGCKSDDEYNTCLTDNDDNPASTSHSLSLNPSNMTVGYNERVIAWTGNDATYSIAISWEFSTEATRVSVFSDANFQGRNQIFGVGSYNCTRSEGSLLTGVGNDAISSVQVEAGYKLLAYTRADYLGYPTVFRGNVSFVEGYNDKISSIKIEVDDNSPPSTGKTLLIYFNGSGKSIDFQLSRNASKIKANDMIFVKGVGGDQGPSPGFTGVGVFSKPVENDGTYLGYNANNFAYLEGELLRDFTNPIPISPFVNSYYIHANVFKNTNANAPSNSYLFGIDEEYTGNVVQGYGGPDSYAIAANVFKVLKRYNLRGYDTILISGHSRGAAVGISSLLYGIKKTVTNDRSADGLIGSIGIGDRFPDYKALVDDVFGNAKVINVLALDPVAGVNEIGLRNTFHMGDDWHVNDIYAWFKSKYPSNFSEIYANGAKQLEHDKPKEAVALNFWEKTFDPSPHYLYDYSSNNVQRYWLGYRHSAMENNEEKLSVCYDIMGVDRPWLHTTEIMNAALHNQTQFRDATYWFNKFRKSDMDGWFGALKTAGCTSPTRYPNPNIYVGGLAPEEYAPDADLEMKYFHAKRHTTFHNTTTLFNNDGAIVDMRTFVPDNNIELAYSSNYKTPTEAGTYTATNSSVDASGWTHYCTCKGELLLSVKKDNFTNIPASAVSVTIPSILSANYYNTGQGFITSPTGAAIMANTWKVTPLPLTIAPIAIRTYFVPNYFGRINQTLSANNNGKPLTDTTKMFFYRATSGASNANIPDIPTADIYTHGATPSLTNWTLGRGERAYYAEYLTNQLTSGGGGASSDCYLRTAYNVGGSGLYCKYQDAVVTLAGSQNGASYQLYLNGNPVGSPVVGTGSPISFNNLTSNGTYTVTTSNAAVNCPTDMTGNAKLKVYNLTPTLYVNTNATGKGDGSTWADAYTNLGNALHAAYDCSLVTNIKVATGTYKPTKKPFNAGEEMTLTGVGGIPLTSRDNTFHIPDGVTIKGGYNAATGNRDITANVTTLSGDFNGNDIVSGSGATLSITNNTENAYHVVLASAASSGGVGVTIDGFTIKGGNANDPTGFLVNGNFSYREEGGGIYTYYGTNTLSNNTLSGNNALYGGGIFTEFGTNTLSNNTLSGNAVTTRGGGIYTYVGKNTLSNNTLSGNAATATGGGIYTRGSTNTMINNTLSGNQAGSGGGIYTRDGTNTLSNNIFWDNKQGTDNNVVGADYYAFGTNGNTFKNNLLQLASSNYPVSATGNSAIGKDATGNIFAQDPLFVNAADPDGADNIHRTADDGLRLQASSPCINTGTATGAPIVDIMNIIRPSGGGVDMGAYEFGTAVLPVELLDFKGTPSLSGNVLTWRTAYENNNRGFQVERLVSDKTWMVLSFVPAKGTNSQYAFTDGNPLSTSYYRLRQMDNDGKETFSKVISIERKETHKLVAYPNPVSNVLTIITDQTGDCQVFNLLGQQVLTGKTPPSGVGGLDVSTLPKGTYVLKVGTEVAKFVKQ